MLRARYGQHAIRLTNGNVLVVGGYNPWANSSPLAIATAELYVPDTQVTLNAVKNPNGGISLSFTNFPGAKFVVVSSPDVTTPLANWELTGPALEADAGLFEFSIPQPVDKARFYRARAE